MQGINKARLRARFYTLLIALLLALPQLARAQSAERIVSIAMMHDDGAALGIKDAAQALYTPSAQTLKLGYSSAAHWLRLRILPDPAGGEIVLLVRPTILDDVQLYVADGAVFGAAIAPMPRYRLQSADWPSSLRGYRITPPQEGGDYFLRIASTGAIAASLTALPIAAAQKLSLINEIIYIFYFTFLLMLFFWSLRRFLRAREAMFGWFSAMQIAWLFHNFFAFGYFTILMPSVDRQSVITVFRCAIIVSALLSIKFHRSVLQRFAPAPWALRLFDLELLLVCSALAIFWSVDHNLGLQLNAWSVACAPLVFLICGITAKTEASPGLTAMRWIYGVFSVVLLLWVITFFGYGRMTVFALYGFMIQGLASGILMFTILELHDRKSITAAKAARNKIIAMENQRFVEQAKTQTMAQFIDMLGHEARNALAVINMSISAGTISEGQRNRVSDAISGLSDVIDRCYMAIRLDSQGQSVSQSGCDLALILRKICDSHLENKRIRLKTPQQASLQSDPVLLAVICGNLIDNALKYSPPQSLVHVDLSAQARCVTLLVENLAGTAGLPDPEQVFQKYYRNPRAKAAIGAGLGLYIVRGLVHLLAGGITYKPTEGRVIFKVSFAC